MSLTPIFDGRLNSHISLPPVINRGDMYKAVKWKPIISDEKAQKMVKALKSGNGDNINEEFQVVHKSYKMISDVLHGMPLPEPVQHRMKSFDGIVSMGGGVQALQFNALWNRLRIDDLWMQFFQMVDARGRESVNITEEVNNVTFSTYNELADIKATDYGVNREREIFEVRSGARVNISNRALERNPMVTIGKILERLNIGKLVKMADDAYTTLADTTGIATTTFLTSLINTVNIAYNAHIQALADNDPSYIVSADTPMFLLCNGTHRATVNAAFRTIIGDNGNNVILEYPVVPVYTYNSNLPATVSGTASGFMIMPGDELLYATFKDMIISRTENPGRDAQSVIANYYDRFNNVAIQKRVVNFA